jgi:hypothetical protein
MDRDQGISIMLTNVDPHRKRIRADRLPNLIRARRVVLWCLEGHEGLAWQRHGFIVWTLSPFLRSKQTVREWDGHLECNEVSFLVYLDDVVAIVNSLVSVASAEGQSGPRVEQVHT